MTTIINLTTDIKELSSIVTNWDELGQNVKDFIKQGTHFDIESNQELLIYTNNKIIASCTVTCLENNKIEIEDCWMEDGNLFNK